MPIVVHFFVPNLVLVRAGIYVRKIEVQNATRFTHLTTPAPSLADRLCHIPMTMMNEKRGDHIFGIRQSIGVPKGIGTVVSIQNQRKRSRVLGKNRVVRRYIVGQNSSRSCIRHHIRYIIYFMSLDMAIRPLNTIVPKAVSDVQKIGAEWVFSTHSAPMVGKMGVPHRLIEL